MLPGMNLVRSPTKLRDQETAIPLLAVPSRTLAKYRQFMQKLHSSMGFGSVSLYYEF